MRGFTVACILGEPGAVSRSWTKLNQAKIGGPTKVFKSIFLFLENFCRATNFCPIYLTRYYYYYYHYHFLRLAGEREGENKVRGERGARVTSEGIRTPKKEKQQQAFFFLVVCRFFSAQPALASCFCARGHQSEQNS